jgi:hypothetical protein
MAMVSRVQSLVKQDRTHPRMLLIRARAFCTRHVCHQGETYNATCAKPIASMR